MMLLEPVLLVCSQVHAEMEVVGECEGYVIIDEKTRRAVLRCG